MCIICIFVGPVWLWEAYCIYTSLLLIVHGKRVAKMRHLFDTLYYSLRAQHCNTLRRTATHCNTLQHTATRATKMMHPTGRRNRIGSRMFIGRFSQWSPILSGSLTKRDLQLKTSNASSPLCMRLCRSVFLYWSTARIIRHHTATHCDMLQHAARFCNTLQHVATCCNMLFTWANHST